MALVAGIDVGTRMTKGVLVDYPNPAGGEAGPAMDGTGRLLSRVAVPTGARLEEAARATLEKLAAAAGVMTSRVEYIASTGYGRYQVPFRHVQITDVTCHAVGARYLFPGTRSVLDIGAMNSRAMRIADSGRVISFRMNDRCASGAGRFLERVARALEVELTEIGELSNRSHDPQPISSVCAVLAESEVINHVTAGAKVEDILRGAHNSIAERIVALLRQVGVEPEITLTGGVTKNSGMVRALEERLQTHVNVSGDAEYAGAIGAALLGGSRRERLSRQAAS